MGTFDGDANPYEGGAHARKNPSTGREELCALNYQRTGYVNSNDGSAAAGLLCQPLGTACPASGVCADGHDCTPKTLSTRNTMFAWRWFDIDGDQRPDLIGSPIQGGLVSYNLQHGNGIAGLVPVNNAPREPAILWADDNRFEPLPPWMVQGFPACPVYSHLSLGTPVARVTRSADASTSVELQFHGLANNTLAAVDADTGVTNAAFVYAPFGELVEATDVGGTHRRRMNDKFVDEVSGLGYYDSPHRHGRLAMPTVRVLSPPARVAVRRTGVFPRRIRRSGMRGNEGRS